MSNRETTETNSFFSSPSKDPNRLKAFKSLQELEKSLSNSSKDFKRSTKTLSSAPTPSLLLTIERELQKINSQIHISSQNEAIAAIQSLVTCVLKGTIPCKECKERGQTVERFTNIAQDDKESAIVEFEKLREMRFQVKKYENLLKSREKSLEVQKISLDEKQEMVERKTKILEENLKSLEVERNKLREERKKLEFDRTQFIRKLKKVDEQLINANKEIEYKESQESSISHKENVKIEIKTEVLNNLSTEVNNQNKVVMEVIGKFAEMKGRLEENHKNLESLIREKLQNKSRSEETITIKLKKLKTHVKEVEEKINQTLSKQQEHSFIKKETGERFMQNSEKIQELEEKNLKIMELKKKCDKLEESLLQKNLKIHELASFHEGVLEKTRENEMKERKLQEIQENMEREKEEIAKTAEMLQEVYLELEMQQKNVKLERKIVETEKETNDKFFEKEKEMCFENEIKEKPFENQFNEEGVTDRKSGWTKLFFRESLHFSD